MLLTRWQDKGSLPVEIETNYDGYKNQNNDKLDESLAVILYFPSTSHFFSPFVQANTDF